MATILTLKPKANDSKRAKPPRRLPYKTYRTREWLTESEVDALIKAAKGTGRCGERDALMILMAYRHGLRVSELTNMRWEQLDLKLGLFHVHRQKHGVDNDHPLMPDELRALKRMERDRKGGMYVFLSLQGAPLTRRGFHIAVALAGEKAGMAFPVHPHMLRHGCGYYLANKGVDTRTIQHYLGHRSIQHTVRYTEISSQRFNGLWD
jgi:type 1 fimbriae regulatory protein FimE